YVRNMKYSNQLQEHVEYTLRRMKEKGIEPSEHTYLLAILGMARQRHKMPYQESRMEKWFYEFLALQMKKPKPFNNLKTVLLAMSRQGHPNLKEMFLTIHQAYPYLDVECWNAALRGCMRAKTPGKAQQLFDIARKINKVDADSYMIMVDSYLHFKDHTSAKEIFVTMMNDKKYTADSRFYGTFIIYYTKSRPNRETFETIDKLWQAVLTTTQRDEKIPPAWIEASLRYYHKYGGLANAEQLFLDLKIRHQTLNKNCISLMYDIICKFSRRRQLRSAISLYYDMLAEGYPIDNTALLAIIKTLKKIDDLPTAESLIKLI
ncbi:hypothetical protein BDF20DRAFT_801278, partial [Mycotypha africana]|uniref:uncharacterized protein n=1 Tax=Mycotypha africana TaxID=64632 RepID=UPI0023001795